MILGRKLLIWNIIILLINYGNFDDHVLWSGKFSGSGSSFFIAGARVWSLVGGHGGLPLSFLFFSSFMSFEGSPDESRRSWWCLCGWYQSNSICCAGFMIELLKFEFWPFWFIGVARRIILTLVTIESWCFFFFFGLKISHLSMRAMCLFKCPLCFGSQRCGC